MEDGRKLLHVSWVEFVTAKKIPLFGAQLAYSCFLKKIIYITKVDGKGTSKILYFSL